ncbi:hypothetical protein [Nocardia sp. NBC_01329]|uniref:hypothetical protein n=1 Tax=Nocardia sp. NBC_01329 TaxID=2903594 RepID=UPI002E137868|nr:hypothetical protein OG405_15990 [Nocardia sp. NBC_01329]
MSDEDDERRRRQVDRERREQRKRSERARNSNDIGRWFHNGIAEIRGETRQNGWENQRSVKLPSGRERIHDAARSLNDHEFREYKHAKSVGGEFVMDQISKEGEHLRSDPKAKGAWIVIEGSPDPAARRELEKLEKEFEGRFQLIEISAEEAERARAIGRNLERNPNQLELFDSGKLRSRERLKEAREKREEKQRVQEAVKKAQEKQERERQIREERRKQREAVERVAERARLDREAVARGEKPPMSPHQAADILRINRPTPGVRSAFREPPQVTRSRRDAPGRDRNRELERDR